MTATGELSSLSKTEEMNSMFLVLMLLHGFFHGFSCAEVLHRNLADSPVCPFDMDGFRQIVSEYATAVRFTTKIQDECNSLLEGFRIVRADYLRRTGYFTFPANESGSCWDGFESIVDQYLNSLSVRATCGVQNQWISDSCMNISTRSQFEAFVPESQLQEVTNLCNRSLNDNSSCAPCVTTLSRIQSAYFDVPEGGNVSDCKGFPYMYAAAFANQYGPFDIGTMKCLFSVFNTSDPIIADLKHKKVHRGVIIGSVIAVLMAILVILLLWRQAKTHWKRRDDHEIGMVAKEASGFEMLSEGITLVRFSIDELKQATMHFSRKNLIGTGGFGNVYKGVLEDGSEVALKRFKNCSVAGDEIFTHEVQVVASVRHINLVALRGYCTVTTLQEGHQRIIVCDYIRNGNLNDHLFSSEAKTLSWPIRRKIAIGIAHGLAYLHNGVQPPIIHRDVKASNILLDEAFEPKLADFGLAKFTPDGFSHVSTRVAGTLGYVCPEYAMYGRLTEKSDVYSFGVVLLELLSGKKAVISFSNNQALLLTDWAWSLVRRGRALEIIEENMPEIDPSEMMEKHVLAAILAVHPLSHARPTMDQIVNMLESGSGGSSNPAFPTDTKTVDIQSLVSFASTSTMFSSIIEDPSRSQDFAFGSRESEEAAFRNTTSL